MTVLRRGSLLSLFLGSVLINAGLGIWALLSSDFGDTEGRVLATSFCVTGGMLGLLVNASPLARRTAWPLPVVAAGSAVAAAALLIAIIWGDPGSDPWWKSLVTLLLVAGGSTLVGLLGLLSLQSTHEPLRSAHWLAVGLLVATSVVALWFELDEDWVGRSIGVESVVVAALTLIVPALARFRPPQSSPPAPPPAAIVCPRCGAKLDRDGVELVDHELAG